MSSYDIGAVIKEIQRIRFDIETNDYISARERCDGLDELLSSVEDGETSLYINDDNILGSSDQDSLMKDNLVLEEKVKSLEEENSYWKHKVSSCLWIMAGHLPMELIKPLLEEVDSDGFDLDTTLLKEVNEYTEYFRYIKDLDTFDSVDSFKELLEKSIEGLDTISYESYGAYIEQGHLERLYKFLYKESYDFSEKVKFCGEYFTRNQISKFHKHMNHVLKDILHSLDNTTCSPRTLAEVQAKLDELYGVNVFKVEYSRIEPFSVGVTPVDDVKVSQIVVEVNLDD